MAFRGMVNKNIAQEEGWKPDKRDCDWTDQVDTSCIPSLRQQEDWFKAMVGGVFEFYGMGCNSIKINGMIFEFLADPDDGYRSHLGSCRVLEKDNEDIFFRSPIANIKIMTDADVIHPSDTDDDYRDGPFRGYYFVDTKDGHIWGRAGTDFAADYYPIFCIQYWPKPPSSA